MELPPKPDGSAPLAGSAASRQRGNLDAWLPQLKTLKPKNAEPCATRACWRKDRTYNIDCIWASSRLNSTSHQFGERLAAFETDHAPMMISAPNIEDRPCLTVRGRSGAPDTGEWKQALMRFIEGQKKLWHVLLIRGEVRRENSGFGSGASIKRHAC